MQRQDLLMLHAATGLFSPIALSYACIIYGWDMDVLLICLHFLCLVFCMSLISGLGCKTNSPILRRNAMGSDWLSWTIIPLVVDFSTSSGLREGWIIIGRRFFYPKVEMVGSKLWTPDDGKKLSSLGLRMWTILKGWIFDPFDLQCIRVRTHTRARVYDGVCWHDWLSIYSFRFNKSLRHFSEWSETKHVSSYGIRSSLQYGIVRSQLVYTFSPSFGSFVRPLVNERSNHVAFNMHF